MKQILFALLFTTALFSACTDGSFKKEKDGVEYRIIKDGKGETVKYGQFFSFHAITRLQGGSKDTLLRDSRVEGGLQFLQYDSVALPQPYYKIFGQMREGDSLILRMKTDSVFKSQPEAMPPFMKKGDWMITAFRVTKIYRNQEEADKARQAASIAAQQEEIKRAEKQLKADDKVLLDYFAKNNLVPVKRENGTYVLITQQGTGPVADTSNFMKINYTGRTLAGKMFDSNTDPAKGHVMPLTVNLTNDMMLGNAVIGGMSSGLRGLAKGAKGKLFIPSSVGYGARGSGSDIGPNEILVFEIEVLELMSKAEVVAQNARDQAKAMADQKRYTDSLSKVQKADSLKKAAN